MTESEDLLLGKIEHRVDGLVIAILVLAGFLVAFMIVEFGLFAFVLTTKTKSGPFEDPDSVVVKGDKKKSKKKKRSSKRGRKSSKSSKTSSKSSKSSKSSAGKPKSKRPKKPASGATGSSEVSSTLKPKKSVKPEKKKESGDKQRQSLPSAEKVKPMRPLVGPADATSGDAATATNIAHIKPQFPGKGHGNDVDTTTEQQIAAIPPQFEDAKTAISPEDPHLSNSVITQIAKHVYEYLAAAACRPQVLPTHVTAKAQQSTPDAVLSSGPGQQTPQPTPFAQPVQIPQNSGRAPLESSYLDVGLNGETPNVVPPIKEVATNSLILNTAPSPANSTSANVADAKPSN